MTARTRLGSIIINSKEDILVDNTTKSALPVQVKLSPEAKAKLVSKAKAAELTVSDFIRVSALSDEKVIFLNGSGGIAKSLAEISTNLDRALRDKEITTDAEKELLEEFGDIYNIFYEILDKLSDINNLEEILEV